MIKTVIYAIKQFINGIYSDIPICCSYFFAKRLIKNKNEEVAFSVLKERGFDIEIDEKVWGFRFKNAKQLEITNEDKVEYVRCDKCFKHKKHRPIKSNGVLF